MDLLGALRMNALFTRPTAKSVLATMRSARRDGSTYEWPDGVVPFEVIPYGSKGGEESRRSSHHAKAEKHSGHGEEGRRAGER